MDSTLPTWQKNTCQKVASRILESDRNTQRLMKRYGNLYEKICDINNLYLADDNARKGKNKQVVIRDHMANRDMNLFNLQKLLLDKKFRTSEYKVFKVYEPKEREVYRLPYYPDRIVHHAIMNILEPIFVRTFTTD